MEDDMTPTAEDLAALRGAYLRASADAARAPHDATAEARLEAALDAMNAAADAALRHPVQAPADLAAKVAALAWDLEGEGYCAPLDPVRVAAIRDVCGDAHEPEAPVASRGAAVAGLLADLEAAGPDGVLGPRGLVTLRALLAPPALA